MKTLIAKEPGLAVYTEEYPRPEARGDQVVAKVLRNGICATDLSILSGEAFFMHDGSTSWPVRFGHEFVGRVVETGPEVRSFKPGDRVIADDVSCGECEQCRKGNYKKCLDLRCTGTVNTWPGSYAEYVMFPERHLHRVPDSISDDAAALIEPASVGMTGVLRLNIVPGQSAVLVTGAGAIGIAAAALAKHYGAKKVLVTGRTPGKLAVAKALGADAVCNTREESLADFVRRETDGRGVDGVIECSGSTRVLDECVNALAGGGTLAIVAFYEKLYDTFDIDRFNLKNCTLTAVMDHAKQEVVTAMLEGLDLTGLITRHIPFDQCGAFMTECIHARHKDDVKVMVDFD